MLGHQHILMKWALQCDAVIKRNMSPFYLKIFKVNLLKVDFNYQIKWSLWVFCCDYLGKKGNNATDFIQILLNCEWGVFLSPPVHRKELSFLQECCSLKPSLDIRGHWRKFLFLAVAIRENLCLYLCLNWTFLYFLNSGGGPGTLQASGALMQTDCKF